ncbi:MAG: S8 family serine peptidase, partial [Mycobacterium sp.]
MTEQLPMQSVTAVLPVKKLRAIVRDRRIASISVDAPVRSADNRNSQAAKDLLLNTLALTSTSASGAGVGVAILDSGFAPAQPDDFENGGPQFYDFTTGLTNPKPSAPTDDYGHGTHVAGLIASDGQASAGLYRGVAPGVKFTHLKVLDANGEGFTSTVANALNFAVANKAKLGIDVINMSLGHPIYEPAATDPLVQAVERAVRAGIVVVVSAGNNGGDPATHAVGYAGINSPGNAPSAITVGAFDMAGTPGRGDDTVPWYSSRGPTWYDGYQKPDLVAPGHHMVSDIDKTSTLYRAYPQYVVYANRDAKTPTAKDGNYFQLSGTSMSSAVVAGAAAVVINAGRQTFGKSLPPNAIKAILEFTAIPIAGYDTLTQGSGALNTAGAIALAKSVDPTVPVGAWWLSVGVTPATTIAKTSLSWAQRVVWVT